MSNVIQFGRDFNIIEPIRTEPVVLSFPYPRSTSSCPRAYNVEIQFRDGKRTEFPGILGVWRKTPKYLARGGEGHLVIWLDQSSFSVEDYLSISWISATPVGPHILDHKLCNIKYLLD